MFDTIIVGAGSAGCVLAHRLSADGARRVLLIEAGGPAKQREVTIPIAFGKLFKTEVDWDYETQPQTHLDGRNLYVPRGKILGGSSQLNAMLYVRGNRRDYDDWAAAGNEGWSYAEVLPYFKRAEHQQRGESEHHGVSGPLRVEEPRSPNPLSRAFVEAGEAAGYADNPDFNGAEQDGFGLYQVTQKRGRRWSAADAYLSRAVLSRPNLTVRSNTLATRVTFDGSRATGVEVRDADGRTEVLEGGEVVLAAGAINSPQLLLLSGVGPADELGAHELEVVADRPGVGANLHDHPAVGLFYECKEPITLLTAESLGNLLKYLLFRRGPLTSTVAEAGGFVRTRAELDRPDIQYHFAPVIFENHGFDPPTTHGFSVGPTLVQPKSRGRLTLASADPTAKPRIDLNLAAEPDDMASLIEGLRVGRKLAHGAPFERWRGAETGPGPEVESDEALAAWVRHKAEALYHPVGTCCMGSDGDAVVDAQLRVHGLEGLRVIDASIMPTIIGGNTNAPTIMIAEKGADLILKGN